MNCALAAVLLQHLLIPKVSGVVIALYADNEHVLDQAPRYIRGHSIVLAFQILAWLLIAANV
jgi:hypothetical protein